MGAQHMELPEERARHITQFGVKDYGTGYCPLQSRIRFRDAAHTVRDTVVSAGFHHCITFI